MLFKYPRTPHLEGSKLQPGDIDSDQISISSLTDGELVWEEKIDGANCGIFFNDDAELQLQSRGHVLIGGPREEQFNLFKRWAKSIENELFDILQNRYKMFGEWMYAKHSVFYDALPHYFMEFDIYDMKEGFFLDTDLRHKLIKDLQITSVPVIHRGYIKNRTGLDNLIKPSLYKTENWKESLINHANKHNLDPERVIKETDGSSLAEGLYLKQELGGMVVGRYKYIRYDLSKLY